MKKVITLLLAFALVVGLSQCKKKVETISSVPAGVYITLDVDGGDKVIVNPHGGTNYATVKFEQGDLIYVGNNGRCCGQLTHDGTRFGGTITPTSGDDADYLHFYFTSREHWMYGDSVSRYESVYDQTAKYPVISYGRSTYLYKDGLTNYSATLQNYCSIMKFPIAGAGTDKTVIITGMNNEVIIDFTKNNGPGDPVNPYTYQKTMTDGGEITLHSESPTEKWAVVLPQAPVDACIHVEGYEAQTISVPEIKTNEYHDNTIGDITLTAATSSFVSGLFSVAAGRQVRFSPGNLQYHSTAGTWRFAQNQYDWCLDRKGWDQPDWGDWVTTDWVDLFGWGTWGQGKNPLNMSTNDSDYQWSTDFSGTIDGYTGYTWRTLTIDEWQYVINVYNESNKRHVSVGGVDKVPCGAGTVMGKTGLILLPDTWDGSVDGNFIYGITTGPPTVRNVYTEKTAVKWSDMEAAGVVFLPCAGNREILSSGTVRGAGYGCECRYWSSTFGQTTTYGSNALCIRFLLRAYDTEYWYSQYWMDFPGDCRSGYAVRLVR